MIIIRRALILNFVLIVFFASSSLAADFYIRASGGVDWQQDANFRDDGTPALFGPVNGSDGRPIGAYGDFGTYAIVEGAVGLRILPWLRTELALAYRPGMHYSGQANFIGVPGPQPVSGNAASLSGLANLYLDINGLPGVSLGRFQPYVGGGVGFAANRLDAMTYRFPLLRRHTYSIIPSGDRTDLAFMVTVGTGFELTNHLVLDLSYRYSDLGRVRTSAGTMLRNGAVSMEQIGGTTAPLRAHGMLVGLRYQF